MFLHPRVFSSALRNIFVSRCTIWERPRTKDALGDDANEADGPATILSGHAGIQCYVARRPGELADREETRRQDAIAINTLEQSVMLDGYYPLIQTTMQAEVDSVMYDIRGVTHNGVHEATKLSIELVK